MITNDPNATLGQALRKIDDLIKIPPSLKKGFSNIYGYTSSEGGIRHALHDEDTIEIDEALFMLISCSAFGNFLISKATKADIF